MIKSKNINFSYKEFDNPDELNQDDRELISVAKKAAANAYAPYSRFRVGAALRLKSGIILSAANVENAAFPSGTCAEKNIISYSVSNHRNDAPIAIAITALTENGLINDSVSPCGNCRQVIAEEELRSGNPIRIILSGKNKTLIIESISDLLPLQFNSNNLRTNLP